LANKSRTKSKFSKKYRTTNWADYNRSLIQRGNFAILISTDVLDSWKPVATKRARGGQLRYSDIAIELALSLRLLFKLGLRQTEGFLHSLVKLAKLHVEVPHFSTLCRRAAALRIRPLQTRAYDPDERVTMIVDSTGLKMYGEREWQAEKHKVKGRKTWRKLHLAIDGQGFIIAHELTTNKKGDAPVAEALVDQVENDIGNFLGDGAYDRKPLYEKLANHNKGAPPNVIIPPRKDAVRSKEGNTPRDHRIQYIKEHGRKAWERDAKYGQRNLVESTMFRYKECIGRKLKSRSMDNQKTEAAIGVKLLNWMWSLGKPITEETA